MSLLRNITSGLRSLFRKDQVDRELNEELGAYLEMEAAEKMKQGMSRRDALRAVRLERGGRELNRGRRARASASRKNIGKPLLPYGREANLRAHFFQRGRKARRSRNRCKSSALARFVWFLSRHPWQDPRSRRNKDGDCGRYA